ncbi:MAG: hypothetical protein IPP81_04610 [Chitinophagaceae bacterium]|nr:hypothetical protein [Chitinophagaceae bacterium]
MLTDVPIYPTPSPSKIPQAANALSIPNPTSGKFQVRYYSVANNVLPRFLTIYDSKGDRVFVQN